MRGKESSPKPSAETDPPTTIRDEESMSAVPSPAPTELSRGPQRWVYAGLGFVFLSLGVVGYIVPGLPGTVFLILSLYCFQKSSRRLERWMLTNRLFGPVLTHWNQHRAMKARTKRVALVFLWGSLGLTAFLVPQPTTWAILAGAGVFVTWILWRIRTLD